MFGTNFLTFLRQPGEVRVEESPAVNVSEETLTVPLEARTQALPPDPAVRPRPAD